MWWVEESFMIFAEKSASSILIFQMVWCRLGLYSCSYGFFYRWLNSGIPEAWTMDVDLVATIAMC